MLWYAAPSCTSTFGTVYEPRNFTCGSHFWSMWHALTELLAPRMLSPLSMLSAAVLPAFAGSMTSQ
jgi:hypothetical protein